MNKMKISGNSYINDLRFPFTSQTVMQEDLEKVKRFAYDMCLGEGHHRLHRTGGQYNRKAGEQFCNTFQGKLAEVVLRNQFIYYGFDCSEADFGVYGEGIWDDADLTVNGKTISVKSAAFFSNLLLLETKDYDNDGNYLPNLQNGTTASYDYYVLVRIKPDIKSLFRKERLLFSNDIGKDTIDRIIDEQYWHFDIAGYITHEEFVEVIHNKQIIPQNALLNGKIPMDAENYYIQSGEMHRIIKLYETLGKIAKE